MLTRLDFRYLFPLTLLASVACAHAGNTLRPCAIRWDAWYSHYGSSEKAQDSLSRDPWWHRAPINCNIGSNLKVTCNGTSQTIDQEVSASIDLGGVDCWLFTRYDRDSSLSVGWRLFENSTDAMRITWGWIIELDRLLASRESGIIDTLSTEMTQSNYLRLRDGSERPVLFILWNSEFFRNKLGSSFSEITTRLVELKSHLKDKGLASPFIVIMTGNPNQADFILKSVGADAISSYNIPLRTYGSKTYANLLEQTQTFWSEMVATRRITVPVIMTGFDQSPLLDRPLPGPAPDPKSSYADASPIELTKAVREVRGFVDRHKDLCNTGIVIIYSWNENAEGGAGLNLTYGDPSGQYLQAIKAGFAE